MPRREVLERHSSRELTELQAYEAVEPFPAERTEIMLAHIAQTIANVNRNPDSDPFPLADFLVLRERPELTEEEQQAALAARVAGAFGGGRA